jgi:acyl-CoA synthetase (AMP-forming)/AMP-acid ligase II
MSRSRYESQIREIIASRPLETAIDSDGVPFTWGQVKTVASAVERLLNDTGLAEFEKVGLMGRNRPAHFAALWGAFVSGRCPSMIHAFQPVEALAADIAANRLPMVFGERRDWASEVVEAANAAGTVGYAFSDDQEKPFTLVTRAMQPGAQTDRGTGDHIALQLLSSGTTGKPKRISLSRTAVDEMIERTIFQFELSGPAAGTIQILPWPLSSLGGSNGALPGVALGQKLVIQEKFNAAGMLELIRRYRPLFLSCAPTAIGMILQLKPSREDFSSLKLFLSGSAPLDPNVRRTLNEEYGLPVAEFYGATEFAGIISGWTQADLEQLANKRGSVGRALPGMQIRIVSSETGESLQPGETGLVEALVPRIGPEWTRTNDLGYVDKDGFLFLEGRADDTILRGGFKVFPTEIAEVLRTHPKVGDAALIGIPDERLGMVPAAAIEKRDGGPAPTQHELEEYLRTKLPAYKIPARFAIVNEIPRTESMKPRREGLRALFGVSQSVISAKAGA